MRLVVDKSSLEESLKTLSSSVNNEPGKITSCVLFKVEDNKLVLKASDNFSYTNLCIDEDSGLEEIEGEGVFTVEESRLSKWVSNVIEDRVEITYSSGDTDVMFRCGSFESPFQTQDPSKFPSQNFDNNHETSETLFEADASVLVNSISFIKDFVSDSTSNSDPTGKLQVAQLRGGEFLGSDARLLGIYKSDSLQSEFKIGYERIGPALSFLKKQSDKAKVRVKQTEKFAFLEVGEDTFFGYTKPREDLPNISNVPTELIEDEVWHLNKEHFLQGIGALQATADPDDDFLEAEINGQGDNGHLTLKMNASQGSREATADISCDREKGQGQGNLQAAYGLIEQALKSYGEEISIAYNSEDNYLKFFEETPEGDVKVCLMTLRQDVL